MNEAELSEYCRRKGLVAEQIAIWQENFLQGNALANTQSKAVRKQDRRVHKEIKQLKRELRQKDKALTETAALLTPRKKMRANWGEAEDE